MAEWVSGIGSLLAVIVALGGYWIVERHRKDDAKQQRQNAAYQIAFKLSALASDAKVTHKHINPEGKTPEEWLQITDPMEICGTLPVNIGSSEPICRDLSENEQNLLMSLKEEDFLMDFSEAFARNQSIEAGLREYASRREAIMSMLPPPTQFQGQVGSLFLSPQQVAEVKPHLIACATLVQSMRELSKQNVEQLSKLCDNFQPMMRKHFPKLHIHKIEVLEGY